MSVVIAVAAWLVAAWLVSPRPTCASCAAAFDAWLATPTTAPGTGSCLMTQADCALCHTGRPTTGDAPLAADPALAPAPDPSEACVTCHIETAIGQKVLYGGDVDNYHDPSSGSGHGRDVTCTDCHDPHSVGCFEGPLAPKMLRIRPFQQEYVADVAAGDASRIVRGEVTAPGQTARDVQLTAFCTECHPAYSDASERTITATFDGPDGVTTATFRNHPMKPVGGERGDPPGEGFASAAPTRLFPGVVSSTSSAGCRSCHIAGETDVPAGVVQASFPHYVPAASALLTTDPALTSHSDGICLRCHRWKRSDGTTGGVGEDF